MLALVEVVSVRATSLAVHNRDHHKAEPGYRVEDGGECRGKLGTQRGCGGQLQWPLSRGAVEGRVSKRPTTGSKGRGLQGTDALNAECQ